MQSLTGAAADCANEICEEISKAATEIPNLIMAFSSWLSVDNYAI
jgi:hypothetical protein